jgi:hypothetical protein
MPFAIELYLNESADRQVRQIWAALDARGIQSLGGIPDSDYRPHVALAVFDQGDVAGIADAVGSLFDGAMGLPLTLAPLGFFLGPEAPAFLGVVPTSQLLSLHDAVCQAVEPLTSGLWPHYQPGALLPHCTLAIPVADKPAVVEVVSGFTTPIPAHVASAHLVEMPGGHSHTRLAGV